MQPIRLYNGPVETAARVLAVLDAFAPEGLDFESLRLADFFCVFVGDLGGPSCLHPPLPMRVGAYGVRGEPVAAALEWLVRLGLVAGDGARAVKSVASLPGFSTPYMDGIQASAAWLAETCHAEGGREAFFARCRRRVSELLGDPGSMPRDQEARFAGLADIYASDDLRLEGLAEAARWFAGLSPALAVEMEAVARAADIERAKVRGSARGLAEVRRL